MSETCKEHRPLLCEEFSEEEFTECPRRYRPTDYRGQAKNTAKGATTIITRWPEHWSSSLAYWWMGLVLMALLIFIIYNSLLAFVLLPTANMKPLGPCTSNKTDDTSYLPEVYMHVFTNSNEEMDLNKYLPYIHIISDKYIEFNFNLFIIYNDTVHETNALSDEENNEIAFNSLWNKEHFYNHKVNNRKNVKVKQVTLSHYMEDSPLIKDWRIIPNTLIEFLVKVISIWEKGGIAINPAILTPRSPNVIYIEKLQTILQKYKLPRENKVNEMKIKKHATKYKDKLKKKVNNIRDIIDNLEHDYSNNDSIDNLTVAEDRENTALSHNGRKLRSTSANKNKTKVELDKKYVFLLPKSHMKSNDTETMDTKYFSRLDFKPHDVKENVEMNMDSFIDPPIISQPKLSLLPLFLEFLFPEIYTPDINFAPLNENETFDYVPRKRRSAIPVKTQRRNTTNPLPGTSNRTEFRREEQDKLIIVSAKDLVPEESARNKERTETKNKHDVVDLTIDLKGNILATKTPCHAFIGTILSNVAHHSPEKSLQEFIIAELSFFCKGLLSSCRGIDLILL